MRASVFGMILAVGLGVMGGVISVGAAHADAGQSSGGPPLQMVKPHITFKTLPNGVAEKTLTFRTDPRLMVPPAMEPTFHVYVYNNMAIAITWKNLSVNSKDPLSVMQKVLPKILENMKDKLATLPHYRFISVLDVNTGGPVQTVNGMFYSPTFFPPGMTPKDLTWE